MGNGHCDRDMSMGMSGVCDMLGKGGMRVMLRC